MKRIADVPWLPPPKRTLQENWRLLSQKLTDSIPKDNLVIFLPFLFVDRYLTEAFGFKPFSSFHQFIADNTRCWSEDSWEYFSDIVLCHTADPPVETKDEDEPGILSWPLESTNPGISGRSAYFDLMPKAGFTFVIASPATMQHLFAKGFKADVVVFFFNEPTDLSNYFYTTQERECFRKFEHPHLVIALGLYRKEYEGARVEWFTRILKDKMPEHKHAKAFLLNYLRHIPDYQSKIAPHDLYSYLFALKFPPINE